MRVRRTPRGAHPDFLSQLLAVEHLSRRLRVKSHITDCLEKGGLVVHGRLLAEVVDAHNLDEVFLFAESRRPQNQALAVDRVEVERHVVLKLDARGGPLPVQPGVVPVNVVLPRRAVEHVLPGAQDAGPCVGVEREGVPRHVDRERHVVAVLCVEVL